jgi:chromosome segregation ATPase
MLDAEEGMMRRSFAVGTLITVSLAIGMVVGTRAASLHAQVRQGTSAQSEDVLPALLVEVRGLRAAMEQIASAGPRVQLALGRVQLQEQRINTLIRRLDEAHAAVAQAQKPYADLKRQIAGLEDDIHHSQSGGPSLEQLNAVLKHTQALLADATVNVQRAVADESDIASTLATEQARWTDLNQRMEALEAALGPR